MSPAPPLLLRLVPLAVELPAPVEIVGLGERLRLIELVGQDQVEPLARLHRPNEARGRHARREVWRLLRDLPAELLERRVHPARAALEPVPVGLLGERLLQSPALEQELGDLCSRG